MWHRCEVETVAGRSQTTGQTAFQSPWPLCAVYSQLGRSGWAQGNDEVEEDHATIWRASHRGWLEKEEQNEHIIGTHHASG